MALAMLCWTAEKRSGYHNPVGPKLHGELIHASCVFPIPYVVFHCLRSFQISETAILVRTCVLHHGFICLFQELLENLGAGSKRGTLD